MTKTIKFMLAGCDICFVAEAPSDITLEQLLKQADKIKPHWCSCGINSRVGTAEVEIIFDYDAVKKANDDVACDICENGW